MITRVSLFVAATIGFSLSTAIQADVINVPGDSDGGSWAVDQLEERLYRHR